MRNHKKSRCSGGIFSDTIEEDFVSYNADGSITSQFKATVERADKGCCSAHSCIGAYFESQPAMLASDDKIFFDYMYQAIEGGDWFEVGVGLYEGDVLKGCKVYRGKEMDNFTTDYFDIPGSGNYKLGFFLGSYDKTGGGSLGATLKVKKFQMTVP